MATGWLPRGRLPSMIDVWGPGAGYDAVPDPETMIIDQGTPARRPPTWDPIAGRLPRGRRPPMIDIWGPAAAYDAVPDPRTMIIDQGTPARRPRPGTRPRVGSRRAVERP
ncbi:hypothetical protein GCM10009608_02470 [Pseudonocardia alaniniphila]